MVREFARSDRIACIPGLKPRVLSSQTEVKIMKILRRIECFYKGYKLRRLMPGGVFRCSRCHNSYVLRDGHYCLIGKENKQK